MVIRKFEEIESWKRARELTKTIYGTTGKRNFARDYGLKDQIQRASVSIMANIPEGFDGGSKKKFYHFSTIRISFCLRSPIFALCSLGL
ncbi:MAG: four helix bundle protein [Bacteroidota bacterium]